MNLDLVEAFIIFFYFIYLFIYLFIYCFIWLHPQHVEVPRLGVKSELWLPAYATATAMWDPSCVCNLHHSLQQLWILNPLNEARDRTLNLMDPSRVRYNWATWELVEGFIIWFSHIHKSWITGEMTTILDVSLALWWQWQMDKYRI